METAASAFDRLGGADAIAAIVDELYDRAQEDPELAPYFHTTDMAVQRGKLAEMLGEALGGPKAPWLLGLAEAHRGRGITNRHFSLLAAHLIDVLLERHVDPDEVDAVMSWVARGREAVVDDPEA
jgi:hemoglobin